MNTSFVFLAEGFEEIEALATVDVMRRAGLPVKTISITKSLQVKGAHGITVSADLLFDNTLFDHPEWLILPGGLPGADNLYEFAPLQGLLERQASQGGKIAAICASPGVVLGRLGLLRGYRATCYPGFQDKMEGASYMSQPVVVDRNIITADGPADTLLFALNIVQHTVGEQEAIKVANGMLLYPGCDDHKEYNFG